MKSFILSITFLAVSISSFAQTLPTWATDLAFTQTGSCELHNLSFSAARFTQIDLHKQRDGLDVYLQVILFLKENNQASYRRVEMGLLGCNETADGPVCGYSSFNDTKYFVNTTWSVEDDVLTVPGLGNITKVRDDFPWLGYELTMSDDFDIEVARGSQNLGGTVGLSFNDIGMSASRICREGTL